MFFFLGIKNILVLTSQDKYGWTDDEIALRICDSNGLCCDTGYMRLQVDDQYDIFYEAFQVTFIQTTLLLDNTSNP